MAEPIARLVDVQETDAFDELTETLRDAGFELEKSESGISICTPDEFESGTTTVKEADYRSRVDALARTYIRKVVTHNRLIEDVPGSIPQGKIGDYAYAMDLLDLSYATENPIQVEYFSSRVVNSEMAQDIHGRDWVEYKARAKFAKDIVSRALELVEGTKENDWNPQWEAIKTNDEYECYVYDEDADSNA